jgi:trehalose/maltose transport system substrate-binding protein
MARTIQEGERAAGNPNFWGFVWQGASYEGLTCVALEWVASEGGGTIVDGDANITINNADAARALARAARWVGSISPPGVTAYQEEEARGVFQGGNAAFMRNWTYAIATGNSEGSPIAGKFAVTMLPRGTGKHARHAVTLGGWQLAVSRFSRQPEAAAALVEYFTNAETLKMRAIRGAFPPPRPDLYADDEVLAAQPFLESMRTILPTAVARPANVTQTSYNRVSVAFYQAVHSVLQGRAEPEAALRQLAQQLERVKGRRGF